MIYRKCSRGHLNSWSIFTVTDASLAAFRLEKIPEDTIVKLMQIEKEYVDRDDFLSHLIALLGPDDVLRYKDTILKYTYHSRDKCYLCDDDLRLKNLPIPAWKYTKFKDLTDGLTKKPDALIDKDIWWHRNFLVGPLVKGRYRQLSRVDKAAFLPPNQYGDDMVTLAKELPRCVYVLYDSRNNIRGYLDLFFFEPDTFCHPDLINPKVLNGELPQAKDILNSQFLIPEGRLRRGKVVDIYIDALCVEFDIFTKALIDLTAKRLLDDPVSSNLWVNRIATVSVQNDRRTLTQTLGGQFHQGDPGDILALRAGLSYQVNGADPKSGLDRTLYAAHYERNAVKLTTSACFLIARPFRYVWPFLERLVAEYLIKGGDIPIV